MQPPGRHGFAASGRASAEFLRIGYLAPPSFWHLSKQAKRGPFGGNLSLGVAVSCELADEKNSNPQFTERNRSSAGRKNNRLVLPAGAARTASYTISVKRLAISLAALSPKCPNSP